MRPVCSRDVSILTELDLGPRVTQDEYLTATEVAQRLKLNVETIYALMKSGELPAARIGGRWRIEASALREWFMAHVQDNEKRAGAHAGNG